MSVFFLFFLSLSLIYFNEPDICPLIFGIRRALSKIEAMRAHCASDGRSHAHHDWRETQVALSGWLQPPSICFLFAESRCGHEPMAFQMQQSAASDAPRTEVLFWENNNLLLAMPNLLANKNERMLFIFQMAKQSHCSIFEITKQCFVFKIIKIKKQFLFSKQQKQSNALISRW